MIVALLPCCSDVLAAMNDACSILLWGRQTYSLGKCCRITLKSTTSINSSLSVNTLGVVISI